MHKKFLRTSVLIVTLAICLGAGHTPGYTMNPEYMDKEELRTYLKNHAHTIGSGMPNGFHQEKHTVRNVQTNESKEYWLALRNPCKWCHYKRLYEQKN